MAKKSKKTKDNLPEGMSRRQAKLAARAAERAQLARDPRPFDGLALEADLIALQEFVPSAYLQIAGPGVEAPEGADASGVTFDRPVYLATVLPGAVAGLRRHDAEGGAAYVALQSQHRGHNPHKDLAFALAWAAQAQPGASLEVGVADGTEPDLRSLPTVLGGDSADASAIAVEQDFDWWLPEAQREDPQIRATLQQANDSVLPSYRVDADVHGAAWWINPGEKAHIRWVYPGDEEQLLAALARVMAAGALHLGEGSKFAGVFRTHGVLVPVWDLDNTLDAQHWAEGLAALDAAIREAVDSGEGRSLTAEEQKARQTIISREVTLR